MNPRVIIIRLGLAITLILGYATKGEDDHGDDIDSATRIGLFSTITASIDSEGDKDVFLVESDQFGILQFRSESDLDTFARILDSEGKEVGSDDDSGNNRNFLLKHGITPGIWHAEVSAYSASDIGTYTLHVSFESNEERPQLTPNLGDFNGDGFDDLLIRNLDGRWYYYPMKGKEYLVEERGFVPITRDLNYGLVAIGDFDDDGYDDIALRHLDGRFLIYFMYGKQILDYLVNPSDTVISPNLQVVGVGDFGRFRDDENILLRDRLTGKWALLEVASFDRAGFSLNDFAFRDVPDNVNQRVVGIGDFDNSGADDILFRHPDGRWSYYLSSSSFSTQPEEGFLTINDGVEWKLAGVGDFNDDGNDDILLRSNSGDWEYYPMQGSRHVKDESGSVDVTSNLDYAIAGIGDLNSDGKDDVILRHVDGSWFYVPMNGRNPIKDQQGDLDIVTSFRWYLPTRVHRATLSGRLNVTEGQVLDGDTGDPWDRRIQNDSIGSAQDVRIPSLIAGYMLEEIDDVDVYRVRLPTRPAKTRFSLVIAEEGTDFDLHLAEPSGAIVSEALGIDELEVIETTRSGWHLIVVSNVSGESNYSLSISAELLDSSESNSQYTASSDGDFAHDQLIVSLTQDQTEFRFQNELTGFKLTHESVTGLGRSVMHLSDELLAQRDSSSRLIHNSLPAFYFEDVSLSERNTLLNIRKKLLTEATVDDVELNYILHANIVPGDPYYQAQWHYESIATDVAWDFTTGDDDVVTAVIDTGILSSHPDLRSRILRAGGEIAGYDFISSPHIAADGDGRDPDPTDPLPGNRGSHGSHVAGTIGMDTDNDLLGAGVTWKGKLLPVRVLGRGGSGITTDVIEAILYSAGLRNEARVRPPVPADIINLSLGRSNPHCLRRQVPSTSMEIALRSAIAAGVVVVVAAGNDDCHIPAPMTQVEGVISVGATDYSNRRTWYSNFGPEIDVVAPGGDVSEDSNADGFPDGVLSTDGIKEGESVKYVLRFFNGTSMASPHMAGVVSLMKSVNSSLTPTDINMLIAGTHPDRLAEPITIDIGAPGRDNESGHGLINAARAVLVARAIEGGEAGGIVEPILRVSPSHLAFGANEETLRAKLDNIGLGDLVITDVEVDVPWISVVQEDLRLIVSVDRFSLDEGIQLGQIEIRSNGGNAYISVSMQVQTQNIEDDIGTTYVLILDDRTEESRGWASTNARTGYSFQLPVVGSGRYYVIAGTDRDGDGLICDVGEACGRWPTTDSPVVLEIERDAQIEFGVSIDLFARVTSESFTSLQIPEAGFPIDRSVVGDGI